MKKIKLIVFILLIISFFVILFYSILGTSLSLLSTKEIKEDRKFKEKLITQIKINDINAIYDKNENLYYYSIPSNYKNQLYVLNINLKYGYKYKIIGNSLNVIKVDYTKKIKIIIYNDKYYSEINLQLTNLPIVSIKSEEEIGLNDTKSIFNYSNQENFSKKTSFKSLIHTRGSSSKKFGKKSYRVDFVDKNYKNDKNVNISNFYYGDSLILDAIYRDPSKIRNVLATELWNDISNDFTNIDIYSEFVEVFINDEYKGLYLLTEPINRKKLNLSKSTLEDTSIIVKPHSYIYVDKSVNIKNINTEMFLDYEIKYPNNEELYEKSWESILSKLSNYYSSNKNYDSINRCWNINNYIDMIIFNAFTNNNDNKILKNNYYYMKSINDDEVYIQPWDMEYTFGLIFSQYDANLIEKVPNDYNTIYTMFKHDNSKRINSMIINRYWELRENILSEEYFDKLLDDYLNELSLGAALRDSKIWYEYDIKNEINDVRTWIYKRLEYFDDYIEGFENE